MKTLSTYKLARRRFEYVTDVQSRTGQRASKEGLRICHQCAESYRSESSQGGTSNMSPTSSFALVRELARRRCEYAKGEYAKERAIKQSWAIDNDVPGNIRSTLGNIQWIDGEGGGGSG
jgi:type II secretory pathway pseudopilin PulG